MTKQRYRAIYKRTPEHVAVPGIPARDLSADEVDKYGGIKLLRNAQCYEFELVDEPETELESSEELNDGC